MKRATRLLLVFILIIFTTSLIGQVKVYKVESTFTKEFDITQKVSFSINSNKAEIKVVPSTTNTIKITTIVSSKNEDKQLAEKDLKKLKHIINKRLTTISIANYVELGSGDGKPTSNLGVTFLIEVPNTLNSDFDIRNDFGKVEFLGIAANTSIAGKFCTVNIIKYQGSLKIESNYGEVSLNELSGELALKSTHSKLSIKNYFGDFTLNSSFSKINLININPEQTSTIQDNHSEINLSHSCLSCNYILFDLEKSEFQFPDGTQVNYSLKEEFKLIGSLFSPKPSQIIKINSNTGIVSLKALSK